MSTKRKGKKRGPGRIDTYLKHHPESIVEVSDDMIIMHGGWHNSSREPRKGEVRNKNTRELIQRFDIVVVDPTGDYSGEPEWPTWKELQTLRAWMNDHTSNPFSVMRQWLKDDL